MAVCLGVLASCTTVKTVNTLSNTPHLLSGVLLFGEEVPETPKVDVLALTDETKNWAKSRGTTYPHAKTRLKRLIQAMIDDGLLSLEYDQNHSLTAQETFEARQGNCLSFSLLFVALAREVDINVQFQMVEVPPSFSIDEELVFLNNHINVSITGIRSDVQFTQNYVVDFNSAEYNGNYKTRRVSDTYAVSLYHGNIAAELLADGQHLAAFRHLKRALRLSPNIAGLWVNLGVLYSRKGLLRPAEQAFHRALAVNANDRSALVNLAKVTSKLGRLAESRAYMQRIQRHLQLNPYYYSHQARIAIQKLDFDRALQEIEKAIALKDDEHQFHHIKGIALYRKGEVTLAQKSLSKAKNVSHRADLRQVYSRKLNALTDDST
ncbi:MAG: tetratricopeptide repeat protein [Pseudomonadota bacterium]